MPQRVLITGGAGFIGHHTVEHILKNTSWDVVIMDGLSYAGSLERLTDIERFEEWRTAGRVRVVFHDLRAPLVDTIAAARIGDVDFAIHMAAQTHVDRSIIDPEPFVMTNVVGTFNLLEWARAHQALQQLVIVSTDEVYGPARRGAAYREWARMKPSNPYAATKAAADALAISYARTYGLNVSIVRSMNNFGERQHPEKFIMKTLRALLRDEKVEIHGSKRRIGSRSWLHARNFADAILLLLNQGKRGDIYNVVGEEIDNLTVANMVADIMNVPLRYRLVDFHKCRPGHDARYALDGRKMARMGWTPPVNLRASLEKTIRWMLARQEWLATETHP